MKTITLYHRKVKGTIKVWKCLQQGKTVYSEWGQLNGKMSRTIEECKPNSLSTAEEQASALFDKKVAKRKKRGYVTSIGNVTTSINVDDEKIDFDRLPRSFAPGKPIKTIEMDTAREWDKKGLLFIQRKRDGMRHYLVSDRKGDLKIYSSGKDDMTEHLKPLLQSFQLPPRTILDCELVVTEPGPVAKSPDGFLIVSGIARSLPDRAKKQIALARGMGALVNLFAFDLLWEEGEATYRLKYEERYSRLAKVIERGYRHSINYRTETSIRRMPLLCKSPTRLLTIDEAMEQVKKHKWEGLVIWRKDQATSVQVNGTPKRVNCWKIKPVGEDDVIATGYELGKGKNAQVVGKFNIAVRGPQGLTSYTPMGRCGTGLDDATRLAALKWTYPCVIQIEYDQRSEKGFRFPVFIRKRDDKKVTDL